jgi:hypothetical protein
MDALTAAARTIDDHARAVAACQGRHERALNSWLAELIDHARQIATLPMARTRASHGAPLLVAAVEVTREALAAWADWPEDDNHAAAVINEFAAHLHAVVEAGEPVAWTAAEAAVTGDGGALPVQDAAELAAAARDLGDWATGLTASQEEQR